MSDKKLGLLKVVNILVAFLGVFVTIYVHRYFFKALHQGELGKLNIFEYALFYMNIFILLLFLFLDFTRKRRISLIVTILMFVVGVYVFIVMGLPIVHEYWDTSNEVMIRSAMDILVGFLETPLLIAIILQYLLKKNKSKLFWMYNIYLLPVIYFSCKFDWFSYDPWQEKVSKYILNYPCSFLMWLLLAISLHIRFVYQKKIFNSIQEQKGE